MISELQILSILQSLGDEYVILREPESFPILDMGSDLDLLVLDRYYALSAIYQNLEETISDQRQLNISESPTHIHLDVMEHDKLTVRFDLIESMDTFRRFSVQESLNRKILLSRRLKHWKGQTYYVPAKGFDLMIRYLEYLEWFQMRPDKIKHLDHILAVSSEKERSELIDNLHRFVRFHHEVWDDKVPPRKDFFSPHSLLRRFASKLSRFIRSKF